MIEVRVEEHQQLDRAIKQFRRKVQRAGILKDLRKKRFYVKPSTARRLKSVAAQRRRLKARAKTRRGSSRNG